MADLIVSAPAEFAKAAAAAKANDIIKIAPGVVVPELYLPSINVDPARPVTITSVSSVDQGTFRAVGMSTNQGKGNFAHLSPGRGPWRGVVFDTVTFAARRSNKFKLPIGDTVTLKKPAGWRCDANWEAVTNPLSENAIMSGVIVGSAASDIVIRNCLVDGFAKGIVVSDAKRFTAEWNDLERNHEDMFMIWGGEDLTFRYNRQAEFDGLDYQDAHSIGWDPEGKSNVPPHADFKQFAGGVKGLKIIGNVMRDDSGRVHGILMNDPKKSGRQIYSDVEITDNRFDLTHTTAFYGGNANNFTFCRNKVVRTFVLPSPPNPKGKNDTKIEFVNLTGTVVVTDNECRKFLTGAIQGQIARNTTTNDEACGFRGYVELREEEVPPEDLYAGVGGKEGDERPEEPPVIEPPIELPPGERPPEPEVPPVAPKPDVMVESITRDGPDLVVVLRASPSVPST